MRYGLKRFAALALALAMAFTMMPVNTLARVLVSTDITNTSGSFQILRMVSPPAPADTYVFYDGGNPPAEIRRQTVIAGDTLIQPETLPSGTGGTFLGWYVDGQKLEFGADGKLTITKKMISNNGEGGSTINVTPKFATVYYVTFYDEDNTTVLSRRPVELAAGETSGTLHFSDLEATSTNPNKDFEYWADDNGNEVGSPVTVSKDMSLYPVFSTGYWITFDANRTPAMAGVNVDYTAPKYVREETATVAPTPPNSNSPAFTFAGWYTEAACQNAFTWGGTISENLTLFAKWNQHQVPFKIIVWTQNVTDDKNAAPAAKTYDAFQVYTDASLVANAGDTVQLSGSAASGFYYGNYWTGIHLDRPTGAFAYNAGKSNTSVTVANDGSSTINVYYDRAKLTIDFHRNGQSGAEDGEYTGLYGQTLEQNGYTWPANYRWTNSSGSNTLTFLDAFIFDKLSGYGTTTYINLYAHSLSGSAQIIHYKEALDGGWVVANTITTSGGTFNFSNKYTGFTVRSYSADNGSWKSASPGESAQYNSKLEIRHKRNSYTVYFYNGS